MIENKPENQTNQVISLQPEKNHLSDFPFFHQASKRKSELMKLTHRPNLRQTAKEFQDELALTVNETAKVLDKQDAAGLDREQQFLRQGTINAIRSQLIRAYFVGAYKFTTRLLGLPDWYWPLTWSGDSTFKDTKELDQILQSWMQPDKKSTTYQAYWDLSLIYDRWLEAEIQHMTFTREELKLNRPYYEVRFPNWGRPARDINQLYSTK